MPQYLRYKVLRLEDAAKDNPLLTPWVGGHVFAENLHVLLEHADNVPGYECTGYQELAGQRVLVYRQREETAPCDDEPTEPYGAGLTEHPVQIAATNATALWPLEHQGTVTGRMSLGNRVENIPRADTTQFDYTALEQRVAASGLFADTGLVTSVAPSTEEQVQSTIRARIDALYEAEFPEPVSGQVSDQIISDLCDTANVMIGYWGAIHGGTVWDAAAGTWRAHRYVYDAAVEGPPVHSEHKIIDSASVWAAVLRILSPDFEVNARIREQFRNGPQQWPDQVDALGADALMQVICFGDIVYG